MKKTLDAHYRNENPLAKSLSNLFPYTFELDGHIIKSMEGFLQSVKTNNQNEKEKVWGMWGISCWKYGQTLNGWKDIQTLYWEGKAMDRLSDEYQHLLERAFDALFENEEFKQRVKESLKYNVTHTIGKTDKANSVLTKDEYVYNLERLRNKLREKRFFNLFG
jgi:hypothetical protein